MMKSFKSRMKTLLPPAQLVAKTDGLLVRHLVSARAVGAVQLAKRPENAGENDRRGPAGFW